MTEPNHISINIDSNIDIPDLIENKINNEIKTTKSTIKNGVQNLTNSFIPGLSSGFIFKNNPLQQVDKLKNSIQDTLNDISSVHENMNDNLNNTINNTLTDINDTIDNVNDVVNNSTNSINNSINNTVNNVTNSLNKKIDSIKSDGNELTNDLISKLSKSNPNNLVDILAAVKQINSDLKSNNKSDSNYNKNNKDENKEENKDENNNSIIRNRKVDRRLLANDILAELPISIRFNDSVNIDNNEVVENYLEDWRIFTEEGSNQLDILLEEIYIEEEKYKSLSKFNHNCARLIQFSLLILGSFIVYIQAAGTDASTIEKTTIVSGAGTTIATSLLTFFSFSKKAPHYSKISFTLKRLRCWLENKCMLPKIKAFSPYDLYSISKKSLDTILLEATEGLQETK
jgi:hypothetical protein